ncbi:hypothetical protein [Methylobacterium segetis]|uniref:hypothetical protein n=1 Tax=Methylobacterium segetis TaxID=2488750 RepID=UPI00104FF5F0|nr:hypothetical protein [Methylobacterium segetis]
MLSADKLQDMAIEVWKRGGLDALVKVSPFGEKPDPSRTIGYCTTFKYVVGRTPAQMEEIVGIKVGSKLSNGAEIFAVSPLPNRGSFDLKGYTQCPGGVPTDSPAYVSHPVYPPGLGAPQWDLARVPQSHLIWLATVRPGATFSFPARNLPKP